ncbi:mycofactocin biosynthesis peptidyl-dipeptidase MftE [Mycolicibacillus parakoreensis]|nr:mycofactocin biosynthesis peptidyl-dipeptidase MftE [Mycolicibacillus parakoreensis]
MAFPVGLGGLTAAQVSDSSAAVLVPVGSTEQHGPHLPLDTDTRIATAVAGEAAARLAPQGHWMLAPALGYGASGEHQGFAGTISLGTEALTLVLVEYGRSAMEWARRLIFVNGHGGNVQALRAAVALLRREGRDVAWVPCTTVGADAHAGHTETSLLLYLSPLDVATDRCERGNGASLAELMPAIRQGGIRAVSEVGVLGDPTTATAVDGQRIFTEMVTECVRRIGAGRVGDDGMLA